VIIVLQTACGGHRRRALQRVAGTVIGGIAAALIARTVHQPLLLGPLLFLFAFAALQCGASIMRCSPPWSRRCSSSSPR